MIWQQKLYFNIKSLFYMTRLKVSDGAIHSACFDILGADSDEFLKSSFLYLHSNYKWIFTSESKGSTGIHFQKQILLKIDHNSCHSKKDPIERSGTELNVVLKFDMYTNNFKHCSSLLNGEVSSSLYQSVLRILLFLSSTNPA